MPKKQTQFTLEDMAHYIIYRELDKLGVANPYSEATKICAELRNSVEYRRKIKR